MTDKPLFIPLKKKFFLAFQDGSKTTEYRLYGPRWNERTCRVGRAVVLSCGYSKKLRLRGTITRYVNNFKPDSIPGWRECYGERVEAIAACITIKVTT